MFVPIDVLCAPVFFVGSSGHWCTASKATGATQSSISACDNPRKAVGTEEVKEVQSNPFKRGILNGTKDVDDLSLDKLINSIVIMDS